MLIKNFIIVGFVFVLLIQSQVHAELKNELRDFVSNLIGLQKRLNILQPEQMVEVKKEESKDFELELLEAISQKNLEKVKNLLNNLEQKGIDLKGDFGNDALIEALGVYDDAIVRLLISKGADINFKDNEGLTILMRAAQEGSRDLVMLLIKNRAKIDIQENESGLTALMFACAEGHIDIAELLILAVGNERGVQYIKSYIDTQDIDGFNALFYACINNHKDIAELLIKQKANIDHQDNYGMTSLMYACKENIFDIAKLLIQSGANINLQDATGKTALMYAAIENRFRIIKLLLENRAKIDIKDNNNSTALIFAAQRGNLIILSLLLSAGADPYIKDKEGKTALQSAKDDQSMKIIKNYIDGEKK